MEEDRSRYILMISFCLCTGSILTWYNGFISTPATILRLALVAGLGLLCPNIRVLLDDRYQSCNILMGLAIGSILFSAFWNRSNYTGSIWVAVEYALRFVLLTWYCEYLDLNGETEYGLKCLFAILLIYCLVSDVLAIIWPHGYYFAGEYYGQYLIGNKFALSYSHLLCLALYCTLMKENLGDHKRSLLFLVLLTYYAAYYSACSTMLVGITGFLLIQLFQNKIKNLLYNKTFFILYFVTCSTVLLIGQALLQIPAIRYIIEEILHESVDLNSRTVIYSKLGSILNISPLFGVGIDNTSTVCREYVGAANVQNGILDVVVSYGWVGAVILIALLIYVVYRSRISEPTALLSVLYVYVFMASVETTLRDKVFVVSLLIILTSWGAQRERESVTEEQNAEYAEFRDSYRRLPDMQEEE